MMSTDRGRPFRYRYQPPTIAPATTAAATIQSHGWGRHGRATAGGIAKEDVANPVVVDAVAPAEGIVAVVAGLAGEGMAPGAAVTEGRVGEDRVARAAAGPADGSVAAVTGAAVTAEGRVTPCAGVAA